MDGKDNSNTRVGDRHTLLRSVRDDIQLGKSSEDRYKRRGLRRYARGQMCADSGLDKITTLFKAAVSCIVKSGFEQSIFLGWALFRNNCGIWTYSIAPNPSLPLSSTVRRYLKCNHRAIDKICYENDLENTVLCFGRIYNVVHDCVFISAEISLFS